MIGIIGGNGVAATNRLMQLIEERVVMDGGYRDFHHPEIISWQATKVPSRSMFLEGRGNSFIPEYIEIGNKLKSCGCTELCMCCNTAHYAINELENSIQLPFINLLEAVALTCKAIGAKKIGMMCSDGLRGIRLYDQYFAKVDSSMQLIYPSNDMQKLVTLGICNSKNTIRNNEISDEHPYKLFSAVSNHLIECNVDCIVGGCTDISAVFSPCVWKKAQYVDSLDVLAKVIYERVPKIW